MARRRVNQKKVPAGQGNQISPSKTPRISDDFDSGDGNTPVWLVSRLELDGPFGWREIGTQALLDDVLRKIRDFETMTWGQILGRNNHSVSVGKSVQRGEEASPRTKA